MPGDSGVGRLYAPVALNPAKKQIAHHENAAERCDCDVEDELSHFNHRYLPYYLPARIQVTEIGRRSMVTRYLTGSGN